MKWFPRFKTHAEACCFKCERTLYDKRASGHAPGRGAFYGSCTCGARTHYDCDAGTGELVISAQRQGDK